MIKVWELISLLNQCDPEAEVVLGDAAVGVAEYDHVDSVYVVKHQDGRADVVALVTGRGVEVD